MKKSSLATSGHTDNDYHLDRLKLKSSPVTQSMCIAAQSRHKDNLMMFSCDHYPFLNEENPPIELLKTVVNLPMTTDRLQKIIRLSHPNIIGVRRIMRGSPRQVYPGCKPQTYYSFYYEMVHYDLKTLAQNPSDNPLLLNSILVIDVQQILRNVVTYLQEVGVHYRPKLENIGVTLNGNIKIYVSPSIVFQSKYDKQISTAIQNIRQWWKSFQIMFHQKYHTRNPYQTDQSYHKRLSLDHPAHKSNVSQQPNNEKMNKPLPISTQPSNHLYIRQLAKIGSIQMEKIRKIDQQVKMIRERLNRAINKNVRQSHTPPQQQIEIIITPPEKKLIKDQVQKLAQSVQKYLVRESIQQNINCINIYNHHTPINPRLASTPKETVRPKRNYIKADSQLYCNDEDCSLDTYDIEFELNYDIPGQSRYRNSVFAPIVDRDQYSDHCYTKRNEGKDNIFKNTKHVNQVSNKHCTESAGPKQFQNFVINIEKTQIQTKKINIDEDPEQYLSQKQEQTHDKQNKDQSRIKDNHRNHFRKMGEQNLKTNPKTTSNGKISNKEQNDTKRRNQTCNYSGKSHIHASQIQLQAKVKLAVTKTKHVLDKFKQAKQNMLSPRKPSPSEVKR